MGLGLRMPEYSSFIRSIRIRYFSGLLVFALASAAVMFALNRVNSYRHEVDALSVSFEGRRGRIALHDSISHRGQTLVQRPANELLVVDDEHCRRLHGCD